MTRQRMGHNRVFGAPMTTKESERKCIVTRKPCKKEEALRFTSDSSGLIFIDLAEKLPGRGYWLQAKRDVLEQAVKQDIFSKAIKGKAVLPENFVECVENLLSQRLIQTIALARKAGVAIGGYEKVKACLMKKDVSVVFTASDAAANSLSKIKGHIAKETFCTNILSKSELGIAFGREIVIHAVILPGGLAKKGQCDAMRLQGLRKSVI